MKIVIPKGSIIILPKRNIPIKTFITKCDFKVDSKDVEIYKDWKSYKEKEGEKDE